MWNLKEERKSRIENNSLYRNGIATNEIFLYEKKRETNQNERIVKAEVEMGIKKV